MDIQQPFVTQEQKVKFWTEAKVEIAELKDDVLSFKDLVNIRCGQIQERDTKIAQLQAENLRLKAKAVERLSVSERMKIERDAR